MQKKLTDGWDTGAGLAGAWERHRGRAWRGAWEARAAAGWPAPLLLANLRRARLVPGSRPPGSRPPGTPGDRGQEAREPGAGSRKTRLRAMSSTGAGSPLRMASRRESLPDR